MVEVFKTNVQQYVQAKLLLDQIHRSFDGYCASFDLEDCDKVLRVRCDSPDIRSACLIRLLEDFGFAAEIMDDITPGRRRNTLKLVNYHS
jgi:hypothetical protein